MDAREYVAAIVDDKAVLWVGVYDKADPERCLGRGHAVLIDEEERMAIFVTDCGTANGGGLPRGTLVKVSRPHPEDRGELRVVGEPAFIKEISWDLKLFGRRD